MYATRSKRLYGRDRRQRTEVRGQRSEDSKGEKIRKEEGKKDDGRWKMDEG